MPNPSPCKVCTHAERAAIEVGLAEHRSIKGMSQRFGMSIFSLYRHRQHHMPPQLIAKLLSGKPYAQQNLDELRVTESEGLLQNAVIVRDRLYRNAESAESVGDFRAAVLAYGKIIDSLTLIGKLLNQFSAHAHVVNNQLIVSPDYLRLRTALIAALEPYPEARQAVARVLREIEAVEVNGAPGA